MSHSAHFVPSPDFSGKRDVHEANSDEHVILGMKMKKELENILQVAYFEHSAPLFFSMVHSKQVLRTKKRIYLRVNVRQRLLNLAQTQERTLRKQALVLPTCCQFRPKSLFNELWVT